MRPDWWCRDLNSLTARIENKSPEVRLLVAVLVRAFADISGGFLADKHSAREARQWFASDNEKPMSFVWIAEAIYPERGDDFVERVRKYLEKNDFSAMKNAGGHFDIMNAERIHPTGDKRKKYTRRSLGVE